MLHSTNLKKHFVINNTPQEWVSLETFDSRQLAGFRTRRIAKVYDGERLYFTIGETQKGKRNGLSATIEGIIIGAGLSVLRVPSTSGRPSVFRGFNLAECPPELLEQVLRDVGSAIARCD